MGTLPVISKGGAAGLLCLALPEFGLGLAIKFESGRSEGAETVIVAILRGLGVATDPLPTALAPFDNSVVRNHRGIQVGDTAVLVDLPASLNFERHRCRHESGRPGSAASARHPSAR